MTIDQTRPSLRSLARRLGVQHSALSKAVHERRLTAGVHIENGRVVVTDADAADAQWHRVHIRRIGEPPPPPPPAPPPDFFADLSKQDLLRIWSAFDVLANVLVQDALSREDAAAFGERITARVRAADREPEDKADAQRLLAQLLRDAHEPEHGDHRDQDGDQRSDPSGIGPT